MQCNAYFITGQKPFKFEMINEQLYTYGISTYFNVNVIIKQTNKNLNFITEDLNTEYILKEPVRSKTFWIFSPNIDKFLTKNLFIVEKKNPLFTFNRKKSQLKKQ